MRSVSVDLPDGARLVGDDIGEGDTILWVSGLGGAARFWQAVTERLPTWRCLTFDQRGIDRSSRGRAPVTIAQLAHDAWSLLDAAGSARAHLVGHSTGGCIVQDMALQQPSRVASLVLSGTWAAPNPYMQHLFALRLALLERAPALYEQAGVFLSYPSDWLLTHPERMAAASSPWSPARVSVVRERIAALLAHDRTAALGQVQVPVLVLGAHDDQIVPFALQQSLAAQLSQAQLQSWRSGGHFFPIVQASAYATTLHDWFASRTVKPRNSS